MKALGEGMYCMRAEACVAADGTSHMKAQRCELVRDPSTRDDCLGIHGEDDWGILVQRSSSKCRAGKVQVLGNGIENKSEEGTGSRCRLTRRMSRSRYCC